METLPSDDTRLSAGIALFFLGSLPRSLSAPREATTGKLLPRQLPSLLQSMEIVDVGEWMILSSTARLGKDLVNGSLPPEMEMDPQGSYHALILPLKRLPLLLSLSCTWLGRSYRPPKNSRGHGSLCLWLLHSSNLSTQNLSSSFP